MNTESLKEANIDELFQALTIIDMSEIGKEEQFAEGRTAIVNELLGRGSETIDWVSNLLVEIVREEL